MEFLSNETTTSKKTKGLFIFNKINRKHWPYIFLMPFFICYFVFNLYPVLFSFFVSLTDWDIMNMGQIEFIGLTNYIKLLTDDPYFFRSIWNTFLFMIGYIPISIILGLLLAVSIFNLSKFKKIFQTLNFLPYITTPVAIGFIFSFMFDWSNGLVNKFLVYIGVFSDGVNWLGNPELARLVVILMIFWKNFGYYFIVYLSGLTSIPAELKEAATVDGASKWQNFYYITLPLLKPITIFLVVTSIINGFQLLDEPMMLFGGGLAGGAGSVVGGPERSALTTIWYFYDTAFSSSAKLGYGAAITYTLFVIILFFSFISFKLIYRKGD